jgi:glycosyltransferase involved in cell wall biosynthesis
MLARLMPGDRPKPHLLGARHERNVVPLRETREFPLQRKQRHVDDFSVALVGPYPPPHGGVSVHIRRALGRLIESGIPARVYCQPLPASCRPAHVLPAALRFSWRFWLPEHGWRCGADILHFHDGWHWSPAALAMLALGRKVVMTFHDQEAGHAGWRAASPLERAASRRLIRHPLVRWVAVSREIRRQLVGLGVPPGRITVLPAYIPPRSDPASPGLPAAVRDFIGAHGPILSTYGWKLAHDEHGVDIYGFDHCLELVGALRVDHPRIGLVISLPQVADNQYLSRLQARCSELGIGGDVLFVTEPLDEVHLIWQASDVYVRATNSDGDAVAVREALSLRVPVVASDASPRPPEVVLFGKRNLPALVGAVRQVLEDRPRFARALETVEIEDNFPPLLSLYRELMQATPARVGPAEGAA